MTIGLLGPLEVTGPAGRVRIGSAKERLVLALLVLRAGEIVPRDALVDAVWNEDPPATAVKTLQGHVARVRRALEAAGLAGVLVTREPGYVLSVPADSIDVAAFERRATAGRDALAEGDGARAAAELRAALSLWRGDALADCRAGGWAAADSVRLDELRISTIEDRIDADLMLGQHSVLVGELESLVARYPLRERIWGALMLAQYRAGRQADALRTYQRARDLLVGELGLEPGAGLRRLEAAVLSGDPALETPAHGPDDGTLAIPLPSRIQAATSSVFVGRAHERELLDTSMKAVAEGERRIVLVSGEPGIGKTSLAAAFAREAFADGAVVAYGRCDDDLGIPYQPWAEILAHLVGHASDEVLAAHVGARGNELARLAPDLARRAPGPPTSSSDAETERHLLFGAVVDLLARVSALAPVVLVLDDLHWADRPTVHLLRRVVSTDAQLRLFVLGTFRDSELRHDHPLLDALAALHREAGVERLALRGLDDDELLTLLETAAGHPMPESGIALRDALAAETDGNPFFVGEMLRHLAETGAIYQDEHDRWVTEPDLRSSGLPVSIREVIDQRVARLGAQTQAVLSLAAFIGRDFDTKVLALAAELGEDAVVDLCDHAVTAAVLTESDRTGRYTFAHALIEHALHDGLSSGRRARAHRMVGNALEQIHGEDPSERIGELAYHWAQASQPQYAGKAIAYAQRAGDHALAQLAPEEARRWYRDALHLLDRADADDPRCRAELLLGLGDAQRQTGDPTHRETLLAACRLADEVDAVDILVRAVLRNSRGYSSIIGGVDQERIEMLEHALSRLGDAASPARARLLALLCAERTWSSDFDERLVLATRAVDMARATGDAAAFVDAVRLSSNSITMPGTLDLRRAWTAEAAALADDLGDPTARLFAYLYGSLGALEGADITAMRRGYAIFVSESERIGQPFDRWQIVHTRAWQQMLDGDLDLAEQLATEALPLGVEAGIPDDAAFIYGAELLGLRWMQGRMPEMIPLIEEIARDTPGRQIFRATLAYAKSLTGGGDDASRLLDADLADDFFASSDNTWLVAQVLWAGAAARSHHGPAATLLHERLLPWHGQFATTHVTVHGAVAHYLGLLAHTLDRHDEADRWFGQALASHEGMEAPFFVAFTQAAWAELLIDRDRPGDAERARALAGAALPVARARGYGLVERDARAVLERR